MTTSQLLTDINQHRHAKQLATVSVQSLHYIIKRYLKKQIHYEQTGANTPIVILPTGIEFLRTYYDAIPPATA